MESQIALLTDKQNLTSNLEDSCTGITANIAITSELIAAMVAEGQTIHRIEQKKQVIIIALLSLQSMKDCIGAGRVARMLDSAEHTTWKALNMV